MHDPFIVTITGGYTVDEIPPRCRKPRPVFHEATATVAIPCVDAAAAPVAFRCHELDDKVKEVRLFNGSLYVADNYSKESVIRPGSPDFPATGEVRHDRRVWNSSCGSADEFQTSVESRLGGFLIIDDQVWTRTGEPRFVVNTYGLGGNHGGTGLSHTYSDNSNVAASSYFRADEFETALSYAVDVANRRGDTRDVARFTNSPDDYRTIEVLIPDAVTLITYTPTPDWVGALRWDYHAAIRELREAGNPVSEEGAFRTLCDLRERIINAGYTPVESEERPFEARYAADRG